MNKLLIMYFYCIITSLLCTLTTTAASDFTANFSSICPSINGTILPRYTLSGKYEVLINDKDIKKSGKFCCTSKKCDAIVVQDNAYIGVVCVDAANCQPIQTNNNTDLIYLKDVKNASNNFVRKNESDFSKDDKGTNNTSYIPSRCEIGLQHCSSNEICVSLNNRRRNGFCECLPNFTRNQETHVCTTNNNSINATDKEKETSTIINLIFPSTSPSTHSVPLVTSSLETTTPHEIEKLVVSINNKSVYLPQGKDVYEDKVTLSAYAIGANDCTYEWNVIKTPKSDIGSMSDPHTQTITLSHLVAGLYVFRVLVEAPGARGEAIGNVTVQEAQTINKPPVAVIVPAYQVVKLPNSGVILDGSASKDDRKIESYHWEIVTGPLGYKLNDETGHTLKLSELIPGNYTIMLKVTDTEKLEGNTTGFVSVIKETDYPPSANAGGGQIIYLPQTETVLNGNASSDDHGIVEWEWTKGPEDSGNAVDMQDTRTPYLKLSNLKEGHYHFTLKVVDNANQSATSSVHVYVQEPNHDLPVAKVNPSLSVTLPFTTVLLDGSNTTGQSDLTNYLWSQLSGPNIAKLSDSKSVKTNATKLTKGVYVFKLTVWLENDKMHNSTANITVIVVQNKNLPPKANAGGDFSVVLPTSVILINGSGSTDDVGITKWLWERDPTSLAAGNIINNSNVSSILMLSDVVAGRYVWKLTVADDQGVTSCDTVSIIVKEGTHYLDEVEVVVGIDIGMLTQSQLSTLLQKLELLLHSSSTDLGLQLISLYSLPRSGHVSLILLGQNGEKVVKGTELASKLRQQVAADSDNKILDLKILLVDTVICQNNCSGHGECMQASRNCRCHSWWMESFFRRHFGDGLANCDWSVIYVFVVSVFGVSISTLFGWLTTVLIVRQAQMARQRRLMKQPRYSLLDSHDENVKGRFRQLLLDSGSDTDSDSEALFDARKARSKDKQKNNYTKMHRIRT